MTLTEQEKRKLNRMADALQKFLEEHEFELEAATASSIEDTISFLFDLATSRAGNDEEEDSYDRFATDDE
jgi:hypothetical protein